MCENPSPEVTREQARRINDARGADGRPVFDAVGFRSDTIAPTEAAWESLGNPPPLREFGKPEDNDGDGAPLFEVFGVLEASEHDGEVQVSVVRCEWFARCTNAATHVVAHPAFPSGVPACNDHGV